MAGGYDAEVPDLVDAGADTVLVERLEEARQITEDNPQVCILVTGGKPVDGRTEADAMAEWLGAEGVDGDRIHREVEAVDTITNARNADLRLALGEGYTVRAVSADEAVSGPLPEWERRAIVRDDVELQ